MTREYMHYLDFGKIIKIYFINHSSLTSLSLLNNYPQALQPIIRVYQLTVDQSFTFQQTEVKDNPASFRGEYGLHIEFPSCCQLSRPGLPLQISSYRNSSQCRVGSDPHSRRSNPGSLRARLLSGRPRCQYYLSIFSI